MPKLSVYAVRAALVSLTAGAVVGTLMLLARAGLLSAGMLRLLPIHQELVLIGWVLQLALGVGYWILPRVEGSRPRAGLAVSGIAALNVGMLCAVVGAGVGIERMLFAGRLVELVGAAAFIAHAWTRVRIGGLINRLTAEEIAARHGGEG